MYPAFEARIPALAVLESGACYPHRAPRAFASSLPARAMLTLTLCHGGQRVLLPWQVRKDARTVVSDPTTDQAASCVQLPMSQMFGERMMGAMLVWRFCQLFGLQVHIFQLDEVGERNGGNSMSACVLHWDFLLLHRHDLEKHPSRQLAK